MSTPLAHRAASWRVVSKLARSLSRLERRIRIPREPFRCNSPIKRYPYHERHDGRWKKWKKIEKKKENKLSNQPIPRSQYEIFVHPYQYLTFILIWIYSSRRLQFKKYKSRSYLNLIQSRGDLRSTSPLPLPPMTYPNDLCFLTCSL